MNKSAYDAGVKKALQDLGLVKQADMSEVRDSAVRDLYNQTNPDALWKDRAAMATSLGLLGGLGGGALGNVMSHGGTGGTLLGAGLGALGGGLGGYAAGDDVHVYNETAKKLFRDQLRAELLRRKLEV